MPVFDLAQVQPALQGELPARLDLSISRTCGQNSQSGEIVVCARPGDETRYRLVNRIEQEQARMFPRAEVRISDSLTADTTTEQANIGGFRSNRVMVRFKFRF